MRRTKIDEVVNYTVHKIDESSISGHVWKNYYYDEQRYINYLGQGRVIKRWSIITKSNASTWELFPVICPSNNWAKLCAAAEYTLAQWAMPTCYLVPAQTGNWILICVYIMYVQTTGNLRQLNKDPQSNRMYAQLLKGSWHFILESSLYNLLHW